jgi:hypothetical protein
LSNQREPRENVRRATPIFSDSVRLRPSKTKLCYRIRPSYIYVCCIEKKAALKPFLLLIVTRLRHSLSQALEVTLIVASKNQRLFFVTEFGPTYAVPFFLQDSSLIRKAILNKRQLSIYYISYFVIVTRLRILSSSSELTFIVASKNQRILFVSILCCSTSSLFVCKNLHSSEDPSYMNIGSSQNLSVTCDRYGRSFFWNPTTHDPYPLFHQTILNKRQLPSFYL